MTLAPPIEPMLRDLWTAIRGAPDALGRVTFAGQRAGLPSVYPVLEAAAAQVAAATLAVAEVHAARTGEAPRGVRVDLPHVAAAFRSERYQQPLGWKLPDVWDPIAGDYVAKDGWIRLHTNYAYHRDAVLRVLGVPNDRARVEAAVKGWEGEALETAVVDAGGCAAVQRSDSAWRAHPQGAAVGAEPLVHWVATAGAEPLAALPPLARPASALAGVRVLDLTRVIAGPVCTRVLAAYGADVVRIDPPGFVEVGALLAETTGGKKVAALDLRSAEGRAAFDRLLADAHVLVSGYRGDALAGLGYSEAELRAKNPGLVIALLDAYGWTGPWRARRGFDSLVQMSAGIAARGAEVADASRPTPLPAQALDHGTGYMMAAAVCRALVERITGGHATTARASLARTARWLVDLGEAGDLHGPDFTTDDAAPWREEAPTAWGPIARVRCPGVIEGIRAEWRKPPGPLGRDAAEWGA